MKTAKHFGDCVHLPIVNASPNVLILDIIPPPELHLLLGTANILFNALLKVWPDATNWASNCHVGREAMHGGVFTGNSCMKLLNKLDILEAMGGGNATVDLYLQTFKDFHAVVNSCFGKNLSENYKACIKDFA